ncbi:CRISPR-associated endoribonuclease Cas6 [Syntrophothermus lipocalidus]|uniref:CRISPR-associated endoribonuclease n=1 Tax=Syntrophothermus lipocalidus (strain DSM 12680 / TGB-C1) TaxID=643648 RepID=D7CN19_SYNLT|nr:CRISPR-associated endoribonuclease Cas6 [Syntrophothermus lipocalidus]ADI02104.1 CRISPR-associated protein Cas6 [Syntrophothermus lipocalidus DSM 12680]
MRLHVIFSSDGPIKLPWNYLHLLHGYLYAAITRTYPDVGVFLHEQGFVVEDHKYKMLVFSRLFPKKAAGIDDGLILQPPFHWWVSSPLSPAMEALAATMLKEGTALIGGVELRIKKIEAEPVPEFTGRVLCEMISPLIASTGIVRNRKLHKRFLLPSEPDFWRVVEDNLRRKAVALGLSVVHTDEMKFEVIGNWKSRLFEAQGTWVRGYEGSFIIMGAEKLFALAYEAGLGERNSQGFGMFRVVEQKGKEGTKQGKKC